MFTLLCCGEVLLNVYQGSWKTSGNSIKHVEGMLLSRIGVNIEFNHRYVLHIISMGKHATVIVVVQIWDIC